jgi:hypothetical protein
MAKADDQPSLICTFKEGWLRDPIHKAMRKPPPPSGDRDDPPEPDEPCPVLCNTPGPRCNAGGAAALLAVVE